MRDLNRYQNHLGFNVNEQDYQPQPDQSGLDAIQRKSAVPYQLPNGPSAFYSEFQASALQRPQVRRFPSSAALNPQWGSPLQNDNKFDFSRPGTRKDQIASINNKPANQLDPRWFGWTQGLAQTQGTSKTNTHSNSLQKNDPGTVETNTHVTSTQNSEGQTDVKQMFGGGFPSPPYTSNFHGYPPQLQQQQQLQQAQRTAAVTRNFRPQAIVNFQQQNQQLNTFARGYQPQLKISNFLKQQQQQQQEAQKRKQIQMNQLNQLLQQQRAAAAQARQINTVTHNHQWGYGNGNGNGHGTGSQGASGSGGGWGTGGPLSQNINLPGWGGNPPEGPPKEPKSDDQQQRSNLIANKLYNIATHPLPAKTMALWNAYIQAVVSSQTDSSATTRQSVSDAHADTTNEAASGVVINPTNGNHVAASNHQWGFGNGNGIAHGAGKGGGDANGGGWGAGGPTHQTTRISQPNGRRSFINPWLSNNMNNANNFNNDFFGGNQAKFQQQQQQFLDRRNSFPSRQPSPQQKNSMVGIPPSNFNNIFRGDPFDIQPKQQRSSMNLPQSNFNNNVFREDPFDIQPHQLQHQVPNERRSLLPQQQQQQQNPFMSYIQQSLPKLVDFTPRTQIPGRQVADPTMNSYLRKKHKKRRRKKRR